MGVNSKMADKKEALKEIGRIKPKIDELNKVIEGLEEQRKQHKTFISENRDSYNLEILNEVKQHEGQLKQINGAIQRAESEIDALQESNLDIVFTVLKEIKEADKHSQDKEYRELEKQIEKVIALHDKIQEQENKLIDELRGVARETSAYLTNEGYQEVQKFVYPYLPLRITQVPKDLKYYVEKILEETRKYKKL